MVSCTGRVTGERNVTSTSVSMILTMMKWLTIVDSIPSGYFPYGSDAVDLIAEEPSAHVSELMISINVIYFN